MPRVASPAEGPEIRIGSRMAKLFRQARQLTNTRACNLDAILDEDEIDLAESDAEEPGYTASLIRFDSEKGGGIMLARGQSRGRRRFSIAYELGHFHLPTHRAAHVQGRCNERDLRTRGNDVDRREWEANDFAAELLMPHRLFAEDARRLSISVDSVDRLASPDMYDVSRLAAAWRLVQITREPAALVVSTHGVVEWLVRSESFAGRLTERQQSLSPETMAAAASEAKAFLVDLFRCPRLRGLTILRTRPACCWKARTRSSSLVRSFRYFGDRRTETPTRTDSTNGPSCPVSVRNARSSGSRAGRVIRDGLVRACDRATRSARVAQISSIFGISSRMAIARIGSITTSNTLSARQPFQ